MNPAAARHFPGIRYGLIGGVCVVILSLIGMVEAFKQREIVTDVITMGQTLLLLMAAFVAYLGAQRAVMIMLFYRRQLADLAQIRVIPGVTEAVLPHNATLLHQHQPGGNAGTV